MPNTKACILQGLPFDIEQAMQSTLGQDCACCHLSTTQNVQSNNTLDQMNDCFFFSFQTNLKPMFLDSVKMFKSVHYANDSVLVNIFIVVFNQNGGEL